MKKHILREVKAFTEVIEEQRNQPFNMKEHIHASLANVVSISMIGEHEHIDTLRQSFRKLFGDMIKLLPKVSILLNCLPFLKYIPGDPLQLLTLQDEFQSFEKLTKERIIEPVLKNPPTEATTFVDMYIEKNKEIDNVADETVFTFDQMTVVLNDILAGGSETIPVTNRWAVLYLVNFPDIQERLQHHIDNMVPAAKVLCLDDKVKLPYVDAFIAEVLRCANIIPLGGPRAEIDGNDAYFEGYLIPKDASIMFDYDSIFMDPKIFEHPELFNPDRFLSEAGAFVAPKKFIPFCVGRRHSWRKWSCSCLWQT